MWYVHFSSLVLSNVHHAVDLIEDAQERSQWKISGCARFQTQTLECLHIKYCSDGGHHGRLVRDAKFLSVHSADLHLSHVMRLWYFHPL